MLCMSDSAIADSEPTRQALAIKDRSHRGQVTGKLRNAINYMVWEGLDRTEAAQKATLADHSLREALKKPHVKRFYLDQLDVLRTSARARNIHRLMEIRDAADNMPAVQAIKVLEQLSEEQAVGASYVRSSPGVTIVIESGKPEPKIIDHEHSGHEPEPV